MTYYLRLKTFFWFAARLFLGIVFAYSGYSKLMQPVENFRGLLADYTILPYAVVPFIAVTFPWIELILGLSLMLGFMTRWSALGLAGMSLGFVVVLGLSRMMLGTLPETCGCFGEGGLQLTTTQVMILDTVDTFLGAGLFAIKNHPWSLDQRLKA